MEAICTIITGNYGHYALALHDSILKFNSAVQFYIFVSKGNFEENIKKEINSRESITILSRDDLKDLEITKKLYDKYDVNFHDALRWGMKGVIMNYLLDSKYERIIYVDCDIYFFNDFTFLFQDLKKNNVLLSPHWRSSNPLLDTVNFKLNFLDGIFNGGFIGASKNGIEALKYWTELCLYNCEVKTNEGFFVDQRYLDILPTRFENIGFIKHKGCNIANWNQIDCKRLLSHSGKVLINNQYPIVFIHFTKSFFRGVLNGSDALLLPYLEEYRNTLLKYSSIDVICLFLDKERCMMSKNNKNLFLLNIVKKIKRKIKTIWTSNR